MEEGWKKSGQKKTPKKPHIPNRAGYSDLKFFKRNELLSLLYRTVNAGLGVGRKPGQETLDGFGSLKLI